MRKRPRKETDGLRAGGTSAPSPESLTLEFPEPFAAAALYVAPNRFCATKNAQLQISPDGEKYTTVLQFELEADIPRTVLEIDIVNLWPNRLIGDAHLPPEKWFCKTNVRKFTSDYPLLASGLLGPVLVESADLKV